MVNGLMTHRNLLDNEGSLTFGNLKTFQEKFPRDVPPKNFWGRGGAENIFGSPPYPFFQPAPCTFQL